jgi:hypothetical protein
LDIDDRLGAAPGYPLGIERHRLAVACRQVLVGHDLGKDAVATRRDL